MKQVGNLKLQVYRLTLDENGQEDVRDFTKRADAKAAFDAAIERRGTFSAGLEYIERIEDCDHATPIEYWERE